MLRARSTRANGGRGIEHVGVLQPGEEIDVWVVDRALGQGGMGSVYRCHNREAKRILAAVKVLDAAFLRLPHAKARFIREAEILFSLDHPGIVKVRNVRMDLAMPYLEMEYIDGVNLETRSREGALSAAEALPLFLQVADALAYLHARGIRHRDVKPSNLVIQPNGVVKLVDFGIAMEADGNTLTERGQAFGSVSYAPPEWLDPERLDPVKWDIYAAGLVFHELLTGVQAFPMAGAGTMQQQVVRLMSVKQRHPPMDPGAGLPRALRALIREMTTPFAEQRIGDAATVRARLAEIDLTEIDLAEAAPPAAGSGPTWYGDPDALPRAGAGRTMVPDFGGPPAPMGNRSDVARAAEKRGASVPPSPAPEPRAIAPASASGGATRAALAVLGVVALLGVGWAMTRPSAPDTRQVRVEVTGLPDNVPVALSLGGAAPSAVDGRTLRFDGVSVGPHPLVAAIGAGCTPLAPGPACGRFEGTVTVDAGADPLVHPLPLVAPAPRVLALVVAGLPEGSVVTATMDGSAPTVGTSAGVSLADVAPGAHALIVWTGACSAADAGCTVPGATSACSPGCASWAGELVVPVGDGEHRADIALPAPTVRADTPAGATAAKPSAERKGPGRLVTASAFARWLGAHPEWVPEAARAAGKADAAYLADWTGGAPPAAKANAPLTNLSWAAAMAHCRGRGGLPDLEEAPLTWEDSPSLPWHEYRVSGGRPAWRRNDGATSFAVDREKTSDSIGFRCAR